MAKANTFFARAKSWAAKKELFGTQAFFRYVIFTFLDCLCEESDEFVCKGGNLLWLYIHTPRQTVDLDLVTRKANTTAKVKKLLMSACRQGNKRGISFELTSIKEVTQQDTKGASATVRYITEDGATNAFDLDIVYVLPTDWETLSSPIESTVKIRGATMENIILDKIDACHRFGGGNTRMKDFDDLWRVAKFDKKVDSKKLMEGLRTRGVFPLLKEEWINIETASAWERHAKKYQDLPRGFDEVIGSINSWLKRLLR